MKRLTDTEAQVLYAHLRGSIAPKDVFLQLIFETGARPSETLTLKATDLVGRSLGIAPLKGSNTRTVTLSPNLAAKLAHLPPARWSDALAAAETNTPSRRKALARHLAETLEALGLRPDLTLKALRHTAFSRLYSATRDLMLVKQWAGHKSIASTLVYMTIDSQERANQTHEDLLKAMGASAD